MEGCEAFFERKNKEKNPGVARLWEGGITESKYQHYFQGSIFSSHNITNPICIEFVCWFSWLIKVTSMKIIVAVIFYFRFMSNPINHLSY